MAERDPIRFDDDNPEWTKEDFVRARPASEMLPPEVAAAFVRKRGRPSGSQKKAVSLRLDEDVIAKFKATGPGWHTRINEALKRAKV
jgi:uncharacterized protein (DUF4415 family)